MFDELRKKNPELAVIVQAIMDVLNPNDMKAIMSFLMNSSSSSREVAERSMIIAALASCVSTLVEVGVIDAEIVREVWAKRREHIEGHLQRISDAITKEAGLPRSVTEEAMEKSRATHARLTDVLESLFLAPTTERPNASLLKQWSPWRGPLAAAKAAHPEKAALIAEVESLLI